MAALDFKNSVKVTTTAETALEGLLTIDGIVLTYGDRVLVRHNTAQNGIYVVDLARWRRAGDAGSEKTLTSGLYVYVEEGALNAEKVFVLTTEGPIVLGTTDLVFEEFGEEPDLSSLVTLGTDQTVTGLKTMTAANIITHANTGLRVKDTGSFVVTLASAVQDADRTFHLPRSSDNAAILTSDMIGQVLIGGNWFFSGVVFFANGSLLLRDTGNDSNVYLKAGNQTTAGDIDLNLPDISGVSDTIMTLGAQQNVGGLKNWFNTNNYAAGSTIAIEGVGLQLSAGIETNGMAGTTTLVAGTAPVANTSVTANSLVIPVGQGTTDAGALSTTITPGVGFSVDSTDPADARLVKYVILELVP